jgi:large subunit ribosomal protein L21
MYAVIETGGKQYKVEKGDRIEVEKIDAAVASVYLFDKVLFVSGGGDEKTATGTPYLAGVKVKGKVLKHMKGDKVIVYKFQKRKHYRRKRGHRQHLTVVEIVDIVKSKN